VTAIQPFDTKGISMNTLIRRLPVLLALAAATLAAGAQAAQAQVLVEEAALDLTLKQTHIKTSGYGLFLSPVAKDVFFPLTITCAGKTSCVVQVQLALKVGGLQPEDDALVAVTLDGAAEQMRPGHVSGPQGLALMRAHGSEAHITQTMTWVDAVAPGTHEISVRVRTLLGEASVGARTLTVSVFK
jgi:hypothetical protein